MTILKPGQIRRKDQPEVRRAWARAWWHRNKHIMKVARSLRVPAAEARRLCEAEQR